MDEIIGSNKNREALPHQEHNGINVDVQKLIADARDFSSDEKVMRVPLTELALLGSAVSSLIPALNSAYTKITVPADGLFRIVNAPAGEAALKAVKNSSSFWPYFKNTDKLAQLQPVGSISETARTTAAFNPAILMMAAAIYSIEREIRNIKEMEQQIISFLEMEKEAEIESELQDLVSILAKFKLNWDNERFTAVNHIQVLDIQRNARKNIIAYQKRITDAFSRKHHIVVQTKMKQALADLKKDFRYYQLSLYTFSLASLLDILLSGNYIEEFITDIRDEIVEMSDVYRTLFDKSSAYLENLGDSLIGANVMKGVGGAGQAVGKVIGSIPVIREGPVDEFLQDKGTELEKNAFGMEKKAAWDFASISNPGTRIFIDKMTELIRIYNHTDEICFDKTNIYLLSK